MRFVCARGFYSRYYQPQKSTPHSNIKHTQKRTHSAVLIPANLMPAKCRTKQIPKLISTHIARVCVCVSVLVLRVAREP